MDSKTIRVFLQPSKGLHRLALLTLRPLDELERNVELLLRERVLRIDGPKGHGKACYGERLLQFCLEAEERPHGQEDYRVV